MTNVQIPKKYNIRPSKKLGQNFLIDRGVLKKIIDTANLSRNDVVLEIGPGLGILTIELAKRAGKIIAIEKDKRMCKILKENLKDYKNIGIINADIIEAKLPVGSLASNIKAYKLIANLPYYITSPVIRKFLEIKTPPKEMILMVQKEVAQRIIAKPGKMSLLSVSVQFYADVKIVDYVNKKSFYPQPRVDSAVIKIIPRPIPKIDSKKFFKIIKAAFSSKRKFLINNLSRELKIENYKLKIVFDQIKLGQKSRAQELSIKDWLELFHKIDF